MAKKVKKIKGTISHKELKKAESGSNDMTNAALRRITLNELFVEKMRKLNNE